MVIRLNLNDIRASQTEGRSPPDLPLVSMQGSPFAEEDSPGNEESPPPSFGDGMVHVIIPMQALESDETSSEQASPSSGNTPPGPLDPGASASAGTLEGASQAEPSTSQGQPIQRKILIPVDIGESSKNALKFYADHVKRNGDFVIAYHAKFKDFQCGDILESISQRKSLSTLLSSKAERRCNDIRQACLEEYFRMFNLENVAIFQDGGDELHWNRGAQIVRKVADWNPNMVVMGTSVHGWWRRNTRQSVSGYVQRKTVIPVIVVKPEDPSYRPRNEDQEEAVDLQEDDADGPGAAGVRLGDIDDLVDGELGPSDGQPRRRAGANAGQEERSQRVGLVDAPANGTGNSPTQQGSGSKCTIL